MRGLRFSALLAAFALFVLAGAGTANAAIIFSLDQGSLQPAEQLQFPSSFPLADNAITIEGVTNITETVFTITGLESLTSPASGQARVESSDGDGFYSALIQPKAADLAFREFEANIRIFAGSAGWATVRACNPSWTGGACEEFTFALSAGENFFVLSVTSSDLLRSILITTTVPIHDLRQIRVGGITSEDVPEPASLALLGLGMAGVIARRRLRRL